QEEAKALASVPAGTAFTVPPVLFAKITEEDLESYRVRFGGAPEQAGGGAPTGVETEGKPIA
ncbi:methionine--tRNA ligase, partial [Streptomyces sp. MCAF7]